MEKELSFIFYNSLYYAVEKETDEMRGNFFRIVLDYWHKGKVPDKSDPCYGYFILAKPSIDNLKKKQKAGSKGGSKRKANAEAKVEANAKQTRKQTQSEKEIEREIKIENFSSRAGARGMKPPDTQKEFVDACVGMGIPEAFSAPLFDELRTNGWCDADGKPIGNWRMYTKSVYNERRNNPPPASDGMTIVRLEDL